MWPQPPLKSTASHRWLPPAAHKKGAAGSAARRRGSRRGGVSRCAALGPSWGRSPPRAAAWLASSRSGRRECGCETVSWTPGTWGGRTHDPALPWLSCGRPVRGLSQALGPPVPAPAILLWPLFALRASPSFQPVCGPRPQAKQGCPCGGRAPQGAPRRGHPVSGSNPGSASPGGVPSSGESSSSAF